MLVRYEDLSTDPVAIFLRAAQFCEPDVAAEMIDKWIDNNAKGETRISVNRPASMRKNKIIVGRVRQPARSLMG